MNLKKLAKLTAGAAGALALSGGMALAASSVDDVETGVQTSGATTALADGRAGEPGTSVDELATGVQKSGAKTARADGRAGEPVAVVTRAMPGTAVSSLFAIDQNRATIVKRIVAQLGDDVARSDAGIGKAQLEQVLQGLRADHLLAASFAANADELRRVVTKAASSDGDRVAAVAPADGPDVVGVAGADLVYTPVTPCRLFDTRISQGGAGTPVVGVRRAVGARVPVANQGGPGGCATSATATVALVLIGTINPSGSGFLQGGPQGAASFPNALILYQQNDQYGATVAMPLNNANGQFELLEQFATADLYGDLLGYFSAPTDFAFSGGGSVLGTLAVGQTVAAAAYKLDVLHGGSTGIRSRSSSGFSVVDIDAVSGDAALRFQKAGVGMWNIRNRPADDYLEIFELGGGGSRVVIQNATGNVGIGETANPTYKLDVLHGGGGGMRVKSSASFSALDIDASTGDAALRFYDNGSPRWNIRNNPANDDLQFFELGATERLRIVNTSGDLVVNTQLGIGVDPLFQLQLSLNSAAKPTSNAWTVFSDVRVKEDIAPFTDGLEKLLRINPVSYALNGKAGLPKGERGVSVIAQEVRDVVPYMVSSYKAKLDANDMEKTDVLTFDSGALQFVTINAIKELVVMLGNQAASKDMAIAALKKRNSSLEARLRAIEKQLKTR